MEIGNDHNNDNHENESENNKLLDEVQEPPAKRLQPSSKTDKWKGIWARTLSKLSMKWNVPSETELTKFCSQSFFNYLTY